MEIWQYDFTRRIMCFVSLFHSFCVIMYQIIFFSTCYDAKCISVKESNFLTCCLLSIGYSQSLRNAAYSQVLAPAVLQQTNKQCRIVNMQYRHTTILTTIIGHCHYHQDYQYWAKPLISLQTFLGVWELTEYLFGWVWRNTLGCSEISGMHFICTT